jgi:hypothetical protein
MAVHSLEITLTSRQEAAVDVARNKENTIRADKVPSLPPLTTNTDYLDNLLNKAVQSFVDKFSGPDEVKLQYERADDATKASVRTVRRLP